MSSPKSDRPEMRVPLGAALIAVGSIILFAVALIYALRPVAPPPLPDLIPLAAVPSPAVTGTPLPTPQPLAKPEYEPVVLLPETSYQPLPSRAQASEAPTMLREEKVPNQPQRLIIPALNIDAPVYPSTPEGIMQEGQIFYQWRVPNAYAAGWHNNSAPLGQPGNTVLNGHHNIYGAIFRDLTDLPPGADIYLEDETGRYHYKVVQQELFTERDQPLEVRTDNARWMQRTKDERITLVSCWPITDNTHRVIVVATPAD